MQSVYFTAPVDWTVMRKVVGKSFADLPFVYAVHCIKFQLAYSENRFGVSILDMLLSYSGYDAKLYLMVRLQFWSIVVLE